MIDKIRRHIFPIAILILLSILIHHVWFLNLSPITWGDWMVDHRAKINEYFSLPNIWYSDSSLGGVNFGISFWPFLFGAGFLSKLNLNIYLIERLVFLWPIALLLPISMYFLSFYILRSKIAAFISALVFEFNTYMIILKGGHLTLLMAMTLTPIFLLFFIKTLHEKKIYLAIISSLLGFTISFYEFRIFYLVCWLAFFYTIYNLVIIERVKSIQQLVRAAFFSALPILIIFFLNLYLLLGINASKSLTSNEVFNQPLFGAWYIKLAKIMTIFHFGWNGETAPTWEIKPIQLQFFFVLVLAILGFIVGTKNRSIPFFGFLGVLGIFFAKQNTPPFPDVYQWLFDRMPGFNAFRESGKFLLYETVSYAILIGAFVKWLWQRAIYPKQKIIAALLTFFIVILFLRNTKPMVTGGLSTLFVQRKIPNDYLIVKDFLSKQKEYFRTLWVPNTSRWSFRLNNIPNIGYNIISNAEWQALNDPINETKTRNFANQLFDLSSIKYVFIPLEDKANDDNFFAPGTRKNLIEQFNKLNYLEKIDIKTREIVVYENKDYRPHIYSTSQKETVHKNLSYKKIDFKYINPTEYKVKLTNVSKPIYINFSEYYDTGWKIKVGDFNAFNVLIDKTYFIPDRFHFKNDAKLNSFFIDPSLICNKFNSCIRNPNGGYDLNLTLYFRPQSYVYLGTIISGIAFLSVIIILCGNYIGYLKHHS